MSSNRISKNTPQEAKTITEWDNIEGSDENEVIYGYNHRLIGNSGSDELIGLSRFTAVSYRNSPEGIVANLSNNIISDGWGFEDEVIDIDTIWDSKFNDNIIGNDRNQNFWIDLGNDTINGGNGYDVINYSFDSKENFMANTVDNIIIKKNASLKNIFINNSRCNGYFYRFIKTVLETGSSCDNYLLSTGLKFNKLDMEIDHKEENSRSSIFSALNLLSSEHQEIKTRINHNAPNCQSYQKIKNVLNDNSKGVYQGKIFVKNIAQKTDAYQLSKALILNDDSEFDAKPELEIYADDVKCSHGSTSGSIDFDTLHYLKSRGIPENEALKMLINGFLNEVLETLSDKKLKFFLLEKLEKQINGN